MLTHEGSLIFSPNTKRLQSLGSGCGSALARGHGRDSARDDAGRSSPRLGRPAQQFAYIGGHPPVGVQGYLRHVGTRSGVVRNMWRYIALAGESPDSLEEPGPAASDAPGPSN